MSIPGRIPVSSPIVIGGSYPGRALCARWGTPVSVESSRETAALAPQLSAQYGQCSSVCVEHALCLGVVSVPPNSLLHTSLQGALRLLETFALMSIVHMCASTVQWPLLSRRLLLLLMLWQPCTACRWVQFVPANRVAPNVESVISEKLSKLPWLTCRQWLLSGRT